MRYYAVIDTNVLVSALLTDKDDSFLITGNKKHFPEVSFVLSPCEYINRLTGK